MESYLKFYINPYHADNMENYIYAKVINDVKRFQ